MTNWGLASERLDLGAGVIQYSRPTHAHVWPSQQLDITTGTPGSKMAAELVNSCEWVLTLGSFGAELGSITQGGGENGASQTWTPRHATLNGPATKPLAATLIEFNSRLPGPRVRHRPTRQFFT